MMIVRLFASLLIFLVLVMPAIVVSVPVVAALLLWGTWRGRTTIFGNAKNGFGNATYWPDFWPAFVYLVCRNPVNNLLSITLGIFQKPYSLEGNRNIGDAIAGGSYWARMGWAWEYYNITPYVIFGSRRCLRVRIGWKINENVFPTAPYVFAVNPVAKYHGI